MKVKRLFILICMIIVFTVSFCGCWDYIEMNDVKYIAGMAIDKDSKTGRYILTTEILEASVSSQIITSKIIESQGETVHEAIRDVIKKVGQMLQASHAKVFIVSKNISKEGIVPVLDLVNRDAEIRNDMWIMIADSNRAADILNKKKDEDQIVSFDLSDTIKNSRLIGKYGKVDVLEFIDNISSKGISGIVPMVKIVKGKKRINFEVGGTAIFKSDKMVGKLEEKETMFLQLLKEKRPKYVIPIKIDDNNYVSLELGKVKKKIKVTDKNGKMAVDINLYMDVDLSEMDTKQINFDSEDEKQKLKLKAEKNIESSIDSIIEKSKNQYKTDILGIGKIVEQQRPKQWKKVCDDWDNIYSQTSTKTNVSINIRYSGLTNKNITPKN
ncbi:Ger(x)C family spore germination protein [Hathewaya limosa]|uniref:Spore germination protein KC n=3 Tax=Hathewaya limosa TaxID=1536 RepID=A0ABU0JR73_HATLI|nr:Ger(x)C family spore germination protein [Hathewaya limosa]MDQ0479597.1 spore germination protein KC [Hathewaya limosa]